MSQKLNQRNVFKLEALVISVVAAATTAVVAVGVDQFVAVVAIIADVTAVSTLP